LDVKGLGFTKAAVTTALLGIFEPEFPTKRTIEPQEPDDKAGRSAAGKKHKHKSDHC